MKTMKKLIIIGTSSTARHVASFVRMHNLYQIAGFAVSEQYKTGNQFMGLPLFTLERLREEVGNNDFEVFVAVLWNHLNRDRAELYNYCKNEGYPMANLISPLASVRGNIEGNNCWIHDFVVIQNDTTICANVFIMAFSLIGANSHVGCHCFFGGRSTLGGGSTVGERSFIGLSATVFDGTQIGRKCIVGACTAVKRNLPDFSRYSSTSDSIRVRQYAEHEIDEKLLASKNIR